MPISVGVVRCTGSMSSESEPRRVPQARNGVRRPFTSARRWEVDASSEFLSWRNSSGVAVNEMTTFAQAVHRTIVSGEWWSSSLAEIAPVLPKVLRDCDSLRFETDAEVRAYAALHLVDRYGRVLQVLEYLFAIGRLPLRHAGAAVLEVGAGPAPALYAVHDFYEDLIRWPGRGEDWSTGPLRISDALDRAPGWDHFLHGLSEQLIAGRRATPASGQLAFGRAFIEFAGLNIRAIHDHSIASLAASIEGEFDRAGEPISQATAYRFAYEQGTKHPSAYDLIFVPNFLTQADAPQTFRAELGGLMRSLTRGGVLVILSGTASQYVGIRKDLETLAREASLTAVGPPEPVEANVVQARRAIVAGQVRETVAAIRTVCSQEERKPFGRLPRDVVDPSLAFTLPRFSVLAFVNQR